MPLDFGSSETVEKSYPGVRRRGADASAVPPRVEAERALKMSLRQAEGKRGGGRSMSSACEDHAGGELVDPLPL